MQEMSHYLESSYVQACCVVEGCNLSRYTRTVNGKVHGSRYCHKHFNARQGRTKKREAERAEAERLASLPRIFDAPEFLKDCLSQLQEEQVVVLYLTDKHNRVVGFEVVCPGRGVVATVDITQHNV